MTTFPFLFFFPSCQQIQCHSFCSFFCRRILNKLVHKLVIHKRKLILTCFWHCLLSSPCCSHWWPTVSIHHHHVSYRRIPWRFLLSLASARRWCTSRLFCCCSVLQTHDMSELELKRKVKRKRKSLFYYVLKVPLWYKLSSSWSKEKIGCH